jgi:hypothetical protein
MVAEIDGALGGSYDVGEQDCAGEATRGHQRTIMARPLFAVKRA